MDLVLQICDDYLLDRVWATLIPLAAFTASSGLTDSLNNTPPVLASFPERAPANFSISLLDADKFTTLYAQTVASQPSISQMSAWPRDYLPRQLVSLLVITLIGIHILYFLFAGLSYKFIFNHEMMRHPRFLKNQVRQEIHASLKSFPFMILLTLPWFEGEVLGYSRLYDGWDTYGYTYLILSVPFFLVFTDYGVYWIHRWLHLPVFYKTFHKPHHKWIIPTPFASHAFHPVDGYLQSVPYHLFIFIFPLHRMVYLGLFVAVNFWSIFIHDSDMITGHALENVINGPAHHTLHHLYFTCNYGQYFTWADRMGKSYRHPDSALDPLLEVQALKDH